MLAGDQLESSGIHLLRADGLEDAIAFFRSHNFGVVAGLDAENAGLLQQSVLHGIYRLAAMRVQKSDVHKNSFLQTGVGILEDGFGLLLIEAAAACEGKSQAEQRELAGAALHTVEISQSFGRGY